MTTRWPIKKLGDIADLRGRIGWRGLTAKEYTQSGPLFLSVHSLNYGDYVDFRDAFHISEERYVESPEIMIQENDVLICKDGAGIGKAGIVGKLPDRATINSSLLMIRPDSTILPKFLYFCLISPYFQQIVQSRLNGATTPHLYQRDITEFPVVLPPLPEQQRIVAMLDEDFEAIATAKANTEKNLQNARALFESHLDQSFQLSDADWHEGTLDEIVHPQCTLSYGIVQPGDEFDDGIPIVRPTDLKQKYIELDGLKRVDPEIAGSYRRTQLVGNEFLLCVRGATGAVSIATPELAGGNVTRGVVPIRFAEDRVLPEFGFHLLSAPPVQRQIRDKTYGTALMQINIKDLRELRVSVPPLKVQQTLAARLDDLYGETRKLEAIYSRKQTALDSLKTSLLHQAFTGNL